MTNLWLAAALTSIFCFITLVFFVQRDLANENRPGVASFKNSPKLLILPALALLAAPLLYLNWPTYQLQDDWNQVAEKTQALKKGEFESQADMRMQDLVLGIRTEAYYHPEKAELWIQLGQVYGNLQMRDAALQSFERGLRVEARPDWLVATAQMLVTSDDEAEMRKAVSYLQHALKQNPSHQSALITLGFTYFKQGQFKDAIDAWQRLASQPQLSQRSRQFVQEQIDLARQKMQPGV